MLASVKECSFIKEIPLGEDRLDTVLDHEFALGMI